MACRTKQKPVFTLDENVLTFSQFFEVQSNPVQLTQAMERTAGNVLHVEKLGQPVIRHRVDLKQIDYLEFSSLQSWYMDIADGAVNSFTLTDNWGYSYTVVWIDGTMNFRPDQHDLWSGSITLEEVVG